MTTLANFPMLSQLSDTHEVNREFDCVPTCIAACLQYLTGKSFDGAAIKDAVYGPNYTGGTDAARYVSYCASQGVKLFPFSGTAVQQIARVHSQLAQKLPAIMTIADMYVPASYGWTHVVAPYSDDEPGTITVLDPYGGKGLKKTDAEWEALLRSNQLWLVEKNTNGGDFMPIDIHTPGVANEFDELDAQHWRSKKTGKVIQFAILSEFKARGYSAGWGHPMSGEVYYAPDKSRQFFTCCVAGWEKATGEVTLLALYDGGAGQDPLIAELETQLAAAKAAQAVHDPLATKALAVVKQVKPLFEPF